ncbi:hypothetical protein LINPERHAP1_LOCUS3177, partial [Linum perenne]
IVAWDPKPDGWLILNTDGSVLESGRAVGGGLLQDTASRCFMTCVSSFGACSITRAS